MDLYFISIHAVEKHMKQQFEPSPDQESPDRPESRHATIGSSARRRLSHFLHALATSIEPASNPPEGATSHQH